jgi:DNA-directed RNA polymerase subunit RPC12/RpoP
VTSATEQATTRNVHCPTCGHWLAEIEVSTDREFRQRLRCPYCHARKAPSSPVVFVRGERVVVISWHGRVDPTALPWPE